MTKTSFLQIQHWSTYRGFTVLEYSVPVSSVIAEIVESFLDVAIIELV